MVKWTNRMHQVAYFELKVTMHGLPSHVLLSLGYKSFQDYLLTLPKFTGSAVQKKFIDRLCSSSIVTGIRLAGTLLCIMCYICCFVWADRSHSPPRWTMTLETELRC
ncbi:unnamed protein product [Musa acuminata subsp. malaccensis]|uniref:(wild Malaysian banana) hypothetical protein n=1 Tax=Musa acuminata subsp. malaccensis TaxID=214687 RepID=A0A804HYQ1_MUSAM|nr:unnamed protein product [Musa acuminata subsp. malaccensis]